MEGLIAHKGAEKMNRAAVALLQTPEGTATHKPVPHIQLIEGLEETLSYGHIGIVREEYAATPDGMCLFGLLELEATGNGFRFALGIRNAHDKSMRLGLTVGMRVMVCDNMAFHGDFTPVMAKHTKRFDLLAALAVGVDAMQRSFKPMAAQVESWRGSQLSDERVKAVIYDAFIGNELDAPKHIARLVGGHYFNPQYEDFAPRTLWSLNNVFTSAFKELEPVPQFKATASLGDFFKRISAN